MDEATVNQSEDINQVLEVDSLEKPKKKKQPTKKQLESLEKARKRKTQLQKERRDDTKHTQKLMNSFVEQNTINNDIQEKMGQIEKKMDEMNSWMGDTYYEEDNEEEYEEDEVEEEQEQSNDDGVCFNFV